MSVVAWIVLGVALWSVGAVWVVALGMSAARGDLTTIDYEDEDR